MNIFVKRTLSGAVFVAIMLAGLLITFHTNEFADSGLPFSIAVKMPIGHIVVITQHGINVPLWVRVQLAENGHKGFQFVRR